MSGDWIKMRLDLAEDPAVLTLAAALDERAETVVGYLHRFWAWLSRNCHDGSVTGVTLVSVEKCLALPGFLVELCKVGWLEYSETNDGPVLTVPHWERHLSQSAKSRALAAIRKRNSRVTKMSRSARDTNVTREEKRREEKNNTPPGNGRKRTEALPALPEDLFGLGPAWCSWVAHLADRGAPLTAAAAAEQFELFRAWGPARAAAAIRHTVSKNWIGLREPPKANKTEHVF